ncbi:MAG: hydantoinase B/oxoprolinase family protein, partial [Deltaproteobacteria bacterium]|nr:hydantoinase B/oxoprolinase family protein [Deltaproteobacteria bacterium]
MFIAATTAHNTDIGGSAPGTFAWDSMDIFGDGLRLPPLKLYDRGVLKQEILDILLANIRAPHDQKKDFYAQMAANNYCKKAMTTLVDKYGKKHVSKCLGEYLTYSERRMRNEIEQMPDGTYHGEDVLEGDGVSDDLINFTTAITIKGDSIHFDWTGSHPQVPGPVNMPSCRTIGSTFVGLAMFIDPDVPQNYGRLAPVSFTMPEKTVVNCVYPAATTCTHEAVGRAISAVIAALTKAMPERGYAQDGWSNMDMGYSGYCERTKRRFAHMHFGVHGYGARATKDGLDAKSNLHGGRIANAPDEIMEGRSSLRILHFGLIQDSGGPGKFRGGLGARLDVQYTGEEVSRLVLGGDRINVPPAGVFGGKDGKGGYYEIVKADGTTYRPKIKKPDIARNGDILRIFHAGAGGYGDPLERDPEAVKEDLLDGYISEKSALEDYGVVVNLETEEVDLEATKELREKIVKERQKNS